MKIVFDVDDTLWPLGEAIADYLGIEKERYYHHFSVRDNSALSKDEQEAIIAAYADVRFFKNIQFFAGIEAILRPREIGAVVQIKSNSFNEQIADLKIRQLLKAVPGLTAGDIKMNIIHYGQAHKKSIDNDATIFIDDSPFNVATSPAEVNILPDLGGWNKDTEAQTLMAGKNIKYSKSLQEINRLIYQETEARLRQA